MTRYTEILTRVRDVVRYNIERRAEAAIAEIHSMAIRDRRSMGQCVRWKIARMG